MDGSIICHTVWSKKEREKQILYNNVYMWNQKKKYRWTYLLGRNRDRDTRTDTWTQGGGGREAAWSWRLGLTYIHCHVWNRWLVGACCIAQRAYLGALWWHRWHSPFLTQGLNTHLHWQADSFPHSTNLLWEMIIWIKSLNIVKSY